MAKGNGVFGELKYVHTPLNEAGFKEVDGEKYYYYMTSYMNSEGDNIIYGQRAKNGFFGSDTKIYYAQENGNLLRNADRSFTEEEAVDIYGNKVANLEVGKVYHFDAEGVMEADFEPPTDPPMPTTKPVETTVAPAQDDTTKGTIPAPVTDVPSETKKGPATSDTPSKTNTTTTGGTTTDNAAIQTGTYSMAAVIFLVLAAFVGFAFYSRRKYNK